MGSALERHAVGRDLPAVREKARELAAASVSANTRRAYEGALCRLRKHPVCTRRAPVRGLSERRSPQSSTPSMPQKPMRLFQD